VVCRDGKLGHTGISSHPCRGGRVRATITASRRRSAHRSGLAGASVTRGIEGYGASCRIHTARILSLSDELPVTVTIIDSEDKIRAFLPQLDELISEGLVTIEQVEAIRYVRHAVQQAPIDATVAGDVFPRYAPDEPR
jgi:PII-like signaling protein